MSNIFITKGNQSTASSRTRAYQISARLLSVQVIPIRQLTFFSWIKLLFSLKTSDYLIIQRVFSPFWFTLSWLIVRKFHQFITIFDIDDATYLYWPLSTKCYLHYADQVWAGSHALVDYAKQYQSQVFLIPTVVSLNDYPPKTNYNLNTIPIIGWIGHGPSHLENLKLLLPVILKLDQLGITCVFRIIGTLSHPAIDQLFSLKLSHVHIETIPKLDWNQTHIVAEHLHHFDLGIMPLVNNEFNQAKCAFKAIEYMACGVPTIASVVGENKYLIKHQYNGLLASNTSEWVTGIQLVLTDPSLRRRLGENGRHTVSQQYCVDVVIDQYVNLLKTQKNTFLTNEYR